MPANPAFGQVPPCGPSEVRPGPRHGPYESIEPRRQSFEKDLIMTARFLLQRLLPAFAVLASTAFAVVTCSDLGF